jgi:hypothetical protein
MLAGEDQRAKFYNSAQNAPQEGNKTGKVGGVAEIRNSDRYGRTSEKTLSFPSDESLKDKKFSEIPTLTKLEYDEGTHIRCMKIFMSDGTESEKAGGFSLDKNFDFSSHDIGKICT